MKSNHIEVLVVKPADQKNVYGGLDSFNLTAYEPPLWTALIAGYVRDKGYSVDILDAEVEGMDAAEIAEYMNTVNPKLTVISISGTNPSASTQNMLAVHKIVENYRGNYGDTGKILLHGIHVSALPMHTMQEEKVDFVCYGEGLETIEKVVANLIANEDIQSFGKIPGLYYRCDGEIRHTEPAQLCSKVDDLPMAAWDLLPMEKYRAHNWHCFDNIEQRQPYGIIWTALGCPFHCHFCCINSMFNGKPGIRFRSPQKVVEEIDYLVSTFHIKNLKITDELFAMNEQRVTEICNLLIKRNYDLNIWAYARVDTVTAKMLHIMKRAGINWIAYGFESGSGKSLEDVEKGYSLDKVADVVKSTYQEGLHIGANYMFGLPQDDYNAMQATLHMAMEINAEWANFNSVMAYPGSGLYREAIKKGMRLPETWQGYSQYAYDCLPMDTVYLKAEEVVAFRDYAFQTYFTNPRYLNKIEKVFGTPAVRHIRNMTKYALPRKNTIFE